MRFVDFGWLTLLLFGVALQSIFCLLQNFDVLGKCHLNFGSIDIARVTYMFFYQHLKIKVMPSGIQNFTISYWIKKGLDRRKVILGMPMYGQSFTLADSNNNGLASPTYGGGEAGPYTRARGFLAYYEICKKVKSDGWKLVRDPESRLGPYAFMGNQWVSFDDVDTIRLKSQFIKEMGLGGAMIWALDLDDFRNSCGCEAYPLLKTINRVLGRLETIDPKCEMPGIFRVQEEVRYYLAEVPSALFYSDCDSGNFKADEKDCTQYKVCSNGNYINRKCSPGLVWNKVNACDWPSNVKGCEISNEAKNEMLNEPENMESANKINDSLTEQTNKPESPPVILEEFPNTGYKIVCYFTNWAWYRPGKGKYVPDDIDPALCTHVNYGFAVLDASTLTMKPHDTWADIDNEFYKKVVALKKKGIKVLIALGGWNDSLGDKYSRLVSSPRAREVFVEKALEFIEEFGFDGLDLDWEYPKCWQVNCDQGPDSDKANFALLVKELHRAFKPKNLLLTAAVSPSKLVIDQGYDVPELNKYLDIINVMSYDYHGHWDKKTGHVAPLKDYNGSNYDYFNAEFTMAYWVNKGADPKKLVMGIPMYGQSFTLEDPKKHDINAPASGKGQQGDYTRAAGFLAYNEICSKLKTGWTVVHHEQEAMGPYAFKGNQWVGYDDVAMVRRKTEFVKANGYGGAMIWALDLDDFANVCRCEKYPLLRSINRILRQYPVSDPKCDIKEHSFNNHLSNQMQFNDFTYHGGGSSYDMATKLYYPVRKQIQDFYHGVSAQNQFADKQQDNPQVFEFKKQSNQDMYQNNIFLYQGSPFSNVYPMNYRKQN